jgi:hypothetical protein
MLECFRVTRSIKSLEAADIRLLMWVAVAFVPLTWAAGVFRKAEGF